MQEIQSFEQLNTQLKCNGKRKRIAVVNATDSHTLDAIAQAINAGFVEAFLIGNASEIEQSDELDKIQPEYLRIIDIPDLVNAAAEAVRMVKNGEADVLMKGLINTDIFLKAVLNKEKGILKQGAVLSHIGVLEVPSYPKLIFFTDAAVIPSPTLEQRISILSYAIDIAHKFGINQPKISLLHASEKSNPKIQYTQDYLALLEMHKEKKFGDVIMDGPLDVFLSLDKESVTIKNIKTPVNGEADILMFPNIESANCFYKGLMLLAKGQMGGILQGTEKPVILMSRSESSQSKYNCMSMACLLAD
jgi:phosphotransacetylase